MIRLVTDKLVVDTCEVDQPVRTLGLLHIGANLRNPIHVGRAVELPRCHGELVEDGRRNPVDMVGSMLSASGVLLEVLLDD
jgi:hypothetical protein